MRTPGAGEQNAGSIGSPWQEVWGWLLNGCQSRGRAFQAKRTAEREAQRCESTQQVAEWRHFGVAAALSSWEHYLKMLELCSEALRGRKEEPSSGQMPTADTSQISAPLPNSQALDEARQECQEESKSQRFEKLKNPQILRASSHSQGWIRGRN